MRKKTEVFPVIEEIKSGWAARGNGWAVHAPTKEQVVEKYNERERFYAWLDSQPLAINQDESLTISV